MTLVAAHRYAERSMPLPGDPLDAVARLVSHGFHDDYVVYESDGQWSFASGVLAEITLDRHGAHLRVAGAAESSRPWDGQPLRQVRDLLDSLPVAGWRAYGWAAFELAYAKTGDVSAVDDRPLLHVVVPHTEVRITAREARLRSVRPETLAEVEAVLADGPAEFGTRPGPVDVRGVGGEDYRRAVADAVGEINARRFQKVIFSRIVPLGQEIDFLGTYVLGRHANSPARSFLLRLGGIEAAGFSPEIVVAVTADGRVTSQPLAGTRALTDDQARNAVLREELLSDAKEIYEHALSVKVACDELRDVCAPDSLCVEEFMAVRERGTVQHLASRVTGRLAEGRHAWDAFGAVFPAVTASGVPKEAVYTSIRSHEARPRGLYSGAVFTVDADDTMDAALVLRAVYRQDDTTWLQAGAGIVGQSLPEREFEETCEKLDSVARFLVPAT
jgi:salicylate synthase